MKGMTKYRDILYDMTCNYSEMTIMIMDYNPNDWELKKTFTSDFNTDGFNLLKYTVDNGQYGEVYKIKKDDECYPNKIQIGDKYVLNDNLYYSVNVDSGKCSDEDILKSLIIFKKNTPVEKNRVVVPTTANPKPRKEESVPKKHKQHVYS